MDKIEKIEMIFLKMSFIIIPFILITAFINNYLNVTFGLFILQITLISILKFFLIRKNLFKDKLIFNIIKVLEFTSLIIITVLFKKYEDMNFVIGLILIAYISLSKGFKMAIKYYVWIIFLHITMRFLVDVILTSNVVILKDYFTMNFIENYFKYYFITFVLIYYFGKINKYNVEYESNYIEKINKLSKLNNDLIKQNTDISKVLENIEEHNAETESENNSLRNTIAEFFTLQHVSDAIISIFEPMELLRSINDIIIGVMGVSGSSVILYDDVKKRLKLHITNIKEQKELVVLKDNINCEFLNYVLENSKIYVENNILKNDEKYPFIIGRDVKSLICIPLILKDKKFGIIILEQKYNESFNENLLNVLDIISHQIVIAIENADLYQRMQELATKDGLTGIYNRLYFQDRLKEEVINAKKQNYDLSVAIFDIDYFKRFNDTYGHLFGDKVIISIANKVKQSLRNTDVFARFGGEEFIILFPRTDINKAYEKIEHLRREIASMIIKDSIVTAYVTVSFGLSSYPSCGNTEDKLIRRADDALYEAKKAGRNCIRSSYSINNY
ncbi:MAG: sensor domain-containing diguanylate cyclase [Clostridiales bacterium]